MCYLKLLCFKCVIYLIKYYYVLLLFKLTKRKEKEKKRFLFTELKKEERNGLNEKNWAQKTRWREIDGLEEERKERIRKREGSGPEGKNQVGCQNQNEIRKKKKRVRFRSKIKRKAIWWGRRQNQNTNQKEKIEGEKEAEEENKSGSERMKRQSLRKHEVEEIKLEVERGELKKNTWLRWKS